eukprot:11227741-Lingulodinium_polyedra.AAC.1
MRQAARSCREFAESLAANLGESFGRRGARDTVLKLYEEAQLAFDWGHLVARVPTREQYQAFFRL